MIDAATRIETADGAPRTIDEADVALLSSLMELSLEFARAIQAQGVAAAEAGDLDRACKAETHFSRLALGIRRAAMLKARLREQQDEARRIAEQAVDERRRRVTEGMTRAIVADIPGADEDDDDDEDDEALDRERLTADVLARLIEDRPDRVDADRADTALPFDALVRSMCRALGIPLERAAIDAAIAGTAKAATGDAMAEPVRRILAKGWFRPADAPDASRPPPRPQRPDSS
jgi:hypothetical protein